MKGNRSIIYKDFITTPAHMQKVMTNYTLMKTCHFVGPETLSIR